MKPIITIDTSDSEEFESECANAVRIGYKLVAAHCGFIDSKEHDSCSSWQAVFALPEKE